MAVNKYELTKDPLMEYFDGYEYLGLDKVPAKLYNPLDHIFSTNTDPATEMVKVMMSSDYLHYSCKEILGFELLPYQMGILDVFWKRKLPMLIASRGAGKTTMLAVYCLLKMIFHQGCRIVIVGSGYRQSRQTFEYMTTIWEKASVLRDICSANKKSGPKREIDRCEFRIGDSLAVAIPIGDGCLSGDNMVTYRDRFGFISDGFESAEESGRKSNIELWSNGQFRTSDEQYCVGTRKTVRVKLSNGQVIKCTPDHKFKIFKNFRVEWRAASSLVRDDRIMLDTSERWHNGTWYCSDEDAYYVGRLLATRADLSNEDTQNNLIKYWGYSKPDFDRPICMPPNILMAPKKTMTEFLRGFLSKGRIRFRDNADDYKYFNVDHDSAPLLDQIQCILYHYGIVAKRTQLARLSRLSFQGKGLPILSYRFPFKSRILQNAMKDTYEKSIAKIIKPEADIIQKIIGHQTTLLSVRAVEHGDDMVCYDLHVPDGHEYCANGLFAHNSKIRGLRANYILADEMASINEHVFNTVVQGFGVVASSPLEKVKESAIVAKMKKMGVWNPELEAIRKSRMGGNQIIMAGTAYYTFNHLYKHFKIRHKLISSGGDFNKMAGMFGDDELSIPKGFDIEDYAIIRIPYTEVPDGLMDQGILNQAKATLTHAQFLCEYCAVFPEDSDGFYKRSIIEACSTNQPVTTKSGKVVQFNVLRTGEPKRNYVIGIDPAADRDNAAIVLLEQREDHRRIVSCWTINKKKHNEIKQYYKDRGIEVEGDYYRFIAKKIREFMRNFQVETVIMDKNGGGTGIMEALGSRDTCNSDEYPVFEVIDPDEPKYSDGEKGIHILRMMAPTMEINSTANHGMLKDFQDKSLLFPMFDTVEVEKAGQLDTLNQVVFDTYEDLLDEIEELKNEICSIVMTGTSATGAERFDTPEVKTEGMRKGRLRKDRYSALLYANYYCRNRDKKDIPQIEYKSVGATKEQGAKLVVDGQPMYRGPGIYKFKNTDWLNSSQIISRKPQ